MTAFASRLSAILSLLVLLVSIVGCGGSAEYDAAAKTPPSEPTPTPEPVEKAAPKPVETERVVADVGVGAKGRSLDEYEGGVEGAIAAPAKALFAAKENAAYNIQVKHALELYRATSGDYPKSHDDFMRDIIKFNQIKLPPLPEGQRYVYDPEQAKLMVERPKR
ncbi:MAG: hypothetical protein KDB14_06160 [Planctomycetales bacterium]|nr:hypothetical protein [Planctomycetales bacterium]